MRHSLSVKLGTRQGRVLTVGLLRRRFLLPGPEDQPAAVLGEHETAPASERRGPSSRQSSNSGYEAEAAVRRRGPHRAVRRHTHHGHPIWARNARIWAANSAAAGPLAKSGGRGRPSTRW